VTGPELVALALAAFALLWTASGGSRLGCGALLVAAEAVVLASAAGTAMVTAVEWAGDGGALAAMLIPYGLAVAVGWAAGTVLGGAGRSLRRSIT
jgi:hypothetical protein